MINTVASNESIIKDSFHYVQCIHQPFAYLACYCKEGKGSNKYII